MRVPGPSTGGVGNVREAEGEVLVAGNVQGRAPLRVDMRALPNALSDPASRRATPDLPAYRSLQLDA